MKIQFDKPTPQTPGYLRRQRDLLKYSAVFTDIETNPTPEAMDSLVEFLLGFVLEPEDRDEAREALWDVSQEEFFEILQDLNSETPEIPKEKGGISKPGTPQD